MKRKRKGVTTLGTGKLYSLAYADDVDVVADDERCINLMMKVFKDCMREEGLAVNVNKTMMMCSRNERCRSEYEWKINNFEKHVVACLKNVMRL